MEGMELAQKFKAVRVGKGFSVYKLSKAADVSENHIHNIEKGESQPSIYIIDKLLKCMGITLSEFFNEEDELLYASAKEREFIELVRTLNDEKSSALFNLAKLLSE